MGGGRRGETERVEIILTLLEPTFPVIFDASRVVVQVK